MSLWLAMSARSPFMMKLGDGNDLPADRILNMIPSLKIGDSAIHKKSGVPEPTTGPPHPTTVESHHSHFIIQERKRSRINQPVKDTAIC